MLQLDQIEEIFGYLEKWREGGIKPLPRIFQIIFLLLNIIANDIVCIFIHLDKFDYNSV